MSARLPASDVAVVGGGVAGCAVAFGLARAGLSVALFERGGIAGEASGAAAGMLTPFSEGAEEGPALRWGRRALERFPSLVEELVEASGVDPEWVPAGTLRVAGDEAAAEALRARARTGEGFAWLDASELRALLPAASPALLGALHVPAEAHVRSPLLARAYAGAAEARGARLRTGVAVRGLLFEGARVVGVRSSEGDAPAGAVVLCPGSFAAECAAWLGPEAELPVAPVRGQIVSLELPPPGFRPIVWGEGAYLVPRVDGSLSLGATTERVGFDRRVTAAGVQGLLAAGTRLVPGLADAGFLGAWAGLRPDTPDHLPLLGPVPGTEGLHLATGHYRTGVLLSPVTAELVADGLLGKGWAEPAFLPSRFPALRAQARS